MVSGEKTLGIKLIETDDWSMSDLLMDKYGVVSPIPLHTNPTEWLYNNYTVHVLCLVSHDKMTSDDWYIDDCNRIRESMTSDSDYWSRRPEYTKIVATNRNDSTLRIDFETKCFIINLLNTNKVPVVKVNYFEDVNGLVTYNRDGSYIILNKE